MSSSPLFHCQAAMLASRPGILAELERSWAVVVDEVFSAAECEAYVGNVDGARSDWAVDFGGEQFTLGRAFYTHYEQDRCQEYFAGAQASDALVERVLPDLQRRLLALVEQITAGVCFRRRGFCGPGVHVFPAHEKVARVGGVLHFDTEGLPEHHARRRQRALSVVVMLGLPEAGGGLKVWDARYADRDQPSAAALRAASCTVDYAAGRAIVIDSYRLHQIQPFQGERDRVSATVHAAEVDPGRWETWF